MKYVLIETQNPKATVPFATEPSVPNLWNTGIFARYRDNKIDNTVQQGK